MALNPPVNRTVDNMKKFSLLSAFGCVSDLKLSVTLSQIREQLVPCLPSPHTTRRLNLSFILFLIWVLFKNYVLSSYLRYVLFATGLFMSLIGSALPSSSLSESPYVSMIESPCPSCAGNQ
jgi:hypothetical protein